MRFRNTVWLCGIATLALLATGCEWMRWMRLLSFKKQLAQLERYVQLDDKTDLSLRFLKPVVYADDLSLLIEDETSRTTNGNRVAWNWVYEKQSASPVPEPGNFSMSFALVFENQKFTQIQVPRRFLTLMPQSLFLGLLRSVGQADVDIRHGSIKLKWSGLRPGEKLTLPTKAQITSLLGAPFAITETNGTRTYLYKYYQQLAKQSPPADRLAWAKFVYADNDGQIRSSEGVIGNIKWSLVRVAESPEPRVTFSLMPLTVEPVALKLPDTITSNYVGQYLGPEGRVMRIGQDGEAFVTSWAKEKSGGWCAAAPELTNVLFGLPSGTPRCTFLHDQSGSVTGLLTQVQGKEVPFSKSPQPPPQPPPAAKVEPSVYTNCAGTYKAAWGGLVFIAREGEQLFWRNQGVQTRIPIYPSSETNFFFKVVESPLTFVKDDKGEVTKFLLHFNGRNLEAVKQK